MKKKYNDLIVGLMDEANLFAEQEEYILAIQSLETIIEIHPIRKEDLGVIIDDLSSKLAEIEAVETKKKITNVYLVDDQPIMKGNRILSFNIKVLDDDRKYKNISLVDSLNHIQTALSEMPEMFELSNFRKGYCPYTWINPSRLHYKGSLMDKLHFNYRVLEKLYNLLQI